MTSVKLRETRRKFRCTKETKDGGRQRVENAGWNDVGGVAGSSGAYIDFGPRTR